MELPSNLARAKLTEITWDKDQKVQPVSGGVSLVVQFNPESLKLAYASQKAGNNQSGGAATQHVGEATTKLSFDLWFDVNAPACSAILGSPFVLKSTSTGTTVCWPRFSASAQSIAGADRAIRRNRNIPRPRFL